MLRNLKKLKWITKFYFIFEINWNLYNYINFNKSTEHI